MYTRPSAQQGAGPIISTGRIAMLLIAALTCYLLSAATSSNTRSAAPQVEAHGSTSRLQELLGCWQAPGLAASPENLDLSVMQDKLQFKHYYVAASTIPGAGMGVFARHDMPKGERAAGVCNLQCSWPAPENAGQAAEHRVSPSSGLLHHTHSAGWHDAQQQRAQAMCGILQTSEAGSRHAAGWAVCSVH
jgi:hypothetical protein